MNKSFTLIEILVVIVVIGVLSAFILVGMNSISSSANIAKGQAFANSLRNSLLISLVSEWRFDNITDYDPSTKIINSNIGNIPDSWGINNGTANGGPVLKDSNNCVSGKCINFTGSNYIEINSVQLKNTHNTGEVCYSVWYRGSGTIIHRGNSGSCQYEPMIAHDYVALSGCGGSGRVVTLNPSSGWNYLVVSFSENSDEATIYLNANLIITISLATIKGNSSSPGNIFNSTENIMAIGATNLTPNFNGYIDIIGVYSNPLSESEILQNYYSGLNNLLTNNNINKQEFNQRLVELKTNTVEHE
jgi:prepilin-type N-terminal cleavage/methylation domain-containing protein